MVKMTVTTLEKFRLNNIPGDAYYIKDFITPEAERELVKQIYSSPKPKWTQLMNRRLQNWGGVPHSKGMIAESIPHWLQTYLDEINCLNLMSGEVPNHVLINEYTPGQGIMPHVDGSLFYPTITTISLGSHIFLDFTQPPTPNTELAGSTKLWTVLLEPRSLLILQNDMYNKYLHGIKEVLCDTVTSDVINLDYCSKSYAYQEVLNRSIRLSLTIRHVPNTSKLKLKLCGK